MVYPLPQNEKEAYVSDLQQTMGYKGKVQTRSIEYSERDRNELADKLRYWLERGRCGTGSLINNHTYCDNYQLTKRDIQKLRARMRSLAELVRSMEPEGRMSEGLQQLIRDSINRCEQAIPLRYGRDCRHDGEAVNPEWVVEAALKRYAIELLKWMGIPKGENMGLIENGKINEDRLRDLLGCQKRLHERVMRYCR